MNYVYIYMQLIFPLHFHCVKDSTATLYHTLYIYVLINLQKKNFCSKTKMGFKQINHWHRFLI